MKAQLAGMAWDVCEPINGGPRISPRISIHSDDKRIYITLAAWELSGGPAAYQVLYSSDERSVGLRPIDPREPSSLAVTQRRDKGGRQISAAGLINRLARDGYAMPMSVPVQWHPDGLLWGDLTMATKRTGKAKGGAA